MREPHASFKDDVNKKITLSLQQAIISALASRESTATNTGPFKSLHVRSDSKKNNRIFQHHIRVESG